MAEKLQMREKLMKIPSGQWFKLTDRPDKDSVIETIAELIKDGYKFLLSTNNVKFMRVSIDLFEWAMTQPEGSEIKTRTITGYGGIQYKFYDLYYNGKLIAIK